MTGMSTGQSHTPYPARSIAGVGIAAPMSAYWELQAARAFQVEKRAFWLADDPEDRCLLAEDAESFLVRAQATRRFVAMLGLPAALAPVVGVLVYSHSRKARCRAADLIGRAALREAA